MELEEEEVVEEEVGTVKPFQCDMCDRRFVCRDERNRHIEEHFKSIECPVCHKFIQGDRAYQYHTSYGKCCDMVEAKRIFKCDICNQKVFDSPEALQQHHNENHNVIIDRSTVLCEICNTKFAHIKYLKKHISEIHTKATQYVCDTCGKKFNRKSNLKEHLLIHTDLRLSKCDVCEKSYRTPSALKLHYRMHTGKSNFDERPQGRIQLSRLISGEKPYVCNMCHVKAYSYNTDLKRHKRTVHGVLGKQFDCQICSKIFYEPKLLRYHMRKCHE